MQTVLEPFAPKWCPLKILNEIQQAVLRVLFPRDKVKLSQTRSSALKIKWNSVKLSSPVMSRKYVPCYHFGWISMLFSFLPLALSSFWNEMLTTLIHKSKFLILDEAFVMIKRIWAEEKTSAFTAKKHRCSLDSRWSCCQQTFISLKWINNTLDFHLR